jgi:hypothetical protein
LHFHRGDGKTVLNDFVPGIEVYFYFIKMIGDIIFTFLVDNLPTEYGGRGLSIASLTGK